jgi:uncharacterized RDD family membrane protein YckC
MSEADWWTRAGGFLLDQLIVAGTVLVLAFAVALVVHDPGREVDSSLLYAIAIVVGVLYAPLLMARGGERNGQTLGKQVLGIRVVRIDGEPVTVWTGVLRTVVAQQLLIAVTFYLYAVVDYLWPLRDARNQALHDKIAKTWVLRTASAPAEPPPTPPLDAPAPSGWLPPQAPGG